jgi:hypothetical protein
MKSRLVTKHIISSELPMASCDCPEQTPLQSREPEFTYSDNTPILTNNVLVQRCCVRCDIYFLRGHTCLLSRFNYDVGEQECEEDHRNDHGENTSEKGDKLMLVMAGQAVNLVNIQSTELTHLMATPETMR